jgi:hypothetical protein
MDGRGGGGRRCGCLATVHAQRRVPECWTDVVILVDLATCHAAAQASGHADDVFAGRLQEWQLNITSPRWADGSPIA